MIGYFPTNYWSEYYFINEYWPVLTEIIPRLYFETLPRADYFETDKRDDYFETNPAPGYFETD